VRNHLHIIGAFYLAGVHPASAKPTNLRKFHSLNALLQAVLIQKEDVPEPRQWVPSVRRSSLKPASLNGDPETALPRRSKV